MSFLSAITSPFSAIGNLVGGVLHGITAPLADIMGLGQMNAMLGSMQQSEQQLMQMSGNSLGQMQKLLNQAVTSANSYASALGQQRIQLPGTQQIPMPNSAGIYQSNSLRIQPLNLSSPRYQQIAPNQPGNQDSIYIVPDGYRET